MDRRQEKTRTAIFDAFTQLLSIKSYSKITVQDIIDTANIGRTTFYAHFDTKDDLLQSICTELFDHIISSTRSLHSRKPIHPEIDPSMSLLCHLLYHLKENDKNILTLLSCESNELFLRYFRQSLETFIAEIYDSQKDDIMVDVPKDFIVNFITGSFVQIVHWWIKNGMRKSPEELDTYYRSMIEPIGIDLIMSK